MNRLILALLALMLAGCASHEIRGDHAGPDAGHAMLALGAAAGTRALSSTLFYRRLQPNATSGARPPVGAFATRRSGLAAWAQLIQGQDYADEKEAGVVLVQSVPAGEYEIFSFAFEDGTGTWRPRTGFSIRFTVRPGELVYLGNYQANAVTQMDIRGRMVPDGVRFVVSNRLERELALARAKVKALPASATNATPEPRLVRSPFIVASITPRAP